MEYAKRKVPHSMRQTKGCRGQIAQVDIEQLTMATQGPRFGSAKTPASKHTVVIRFQPGKKVIVVQTQGTSGQRVGAKRALARINPARSSPYALDLIRHLLSEQLPGYEPTLLGKHIATLKPFKNGGSQAIRLPASEAAGVVGWEVEKLEDGRLILQPIREKKSAADLLRRFAALKVDLFPEGREAMEFPERDW